jgi:hypothetical protein
MISNVDDMDMDNVVTELRPVRDASGKLRYIEVVKDTIGTKPETAHSEPEPEPEPAEWDEPLALADFDLPPFPVDALPAWLASFVEAAAVSLQVPVDMPGTLALTACGAAVARKFIARMTSDWKEPLVIMTLVVMPSGERKSPSVELAIAPIAEYGQELVAASRGEIEAGS